MATIQNQVLQAFKNAGLSENQARIITAEVGRENSFLPDTIFGVHRDPKNNAVNLGMLSWQGNRGQQLYRTLASSGLIQGDRIVQDQKALDAMAKYAVHEMKTRPEYKQTAQTFLANPDVDYQTANKVLGRNFIRWRYDDSKYATGHKNRDHFYKQLGGGQVQEKQLTLADLERQYGKGQAYDFNSEAASKALTVADLEQMYGKGQAYQF